MGFSDVTHVYDGRGTGAIQAAGVGIAAAIIDVPYGPKEEWLTLMKPADWLAVCPQPETTDTWFNDWWNVYYALKRGIFGKRSRLTLKVWITGHYTDASDPSTLTAQKQYLDILDSTSGTSFRILDDYYQNDLSGKIVPSSLDTTSLFDIEIYKGDTLYDSARNCNMTTTSPNYVGKIVGSNRKWSILDYGLGTLPANGLSMDKTDFTAPDYVIGTTVVADFVGVASETKNTGFYALNQFINDLDGPEYVMVPHKFTDDDDTISLINQLITYCYTYGFIPIVAAPSGLDRTQVKAMCQGTGDYSTSLYNDIGGTIIAWPWGTPPELADSQDTTTGLRKRISPECAKLGALAAVIGRKWIEEAAAGIDYGDTGFIELERVTSDDDKTYLNPVGVQVIVKVKGKYIFDCHGTLSTDPKFFDETVRRMDNLLIRSIDYSTVDDVHRKIPPRKMRAMERKVIAFVRNLYKQHPDMWRYDTFEQSFQFDVEGQNDLESADYEAGKIYTAWNAIYAPSADSITHRYSHDTNRSEVVG